MSGDLFYTDQALVTSSEWQHCEIQWTPGQAGSASVGLSGLLGFAYVNIYKGNVESGELIVARARLALC